jgi:hypothetical protein
VSGGLACLARDVHMLFNGSLCLLTVWAGIMRAPDSKRT